MRNPIQDYLESLADHGHYAVGKVASYIPELAAADPERFALCRQKAEINAITARQ